MLVEWIHEVLFFDLGRGDNDVCLLLTYTGVGCHSLVQGIFPMQGSNLGLLHCRQILYHLNLLSHIVDLFFTFSVSRFYFPIKG